MAKIKIALTRKKLLVSTVLGAVIILGGIMAWIKFDPLASKEEEKNVPISVDSVRSQASEYAESGDVDKAIEYYDQQIKAEESDDKKLEILIDKTYLATRYERYDEAITAGEQAVKIDSGLSAALALAQAYEAKGDKEQALKYYQMLADEAIKDGEPNGRDGNRWQLKVEELSS